MDREMGSSRLRQFIERESGGMLGTLRYYLFRAGLANRVQPLDEAAEELLNDVISEALAHEDRFRASGQPRAWMLGIAANIIKRRQVELRRLEEREPLVRDMYPYDERGEDELFDWMGSLTEAGSVEELEGNAHAAALLAAVSPEDSRVIRLAILHDLDGESLARELGTTPGAARVRLHRALNRLRVVYQRQEQGDE